ncbi:MAG: hypothetical protein Q9207_003374 [Kuettlingeria erythrocarpa]
MGTLAPTGPRPKKPTRAPTAVPPGLSLPQDFPPLAAPSVPAVAPLKPQKRTNPLSTPANAIKPVVPVVPSQMTKNVSTMVAKDASSEPSTAKEDVPAKSLFIPAESVPKPKSRKDAESSESMPPPRAKKITASSDTAFLDNAQLTNDLPAPSEHAAEKKKETAKRHPGRLNLEATQKGLDAKSRPLETSKTTANTNEDVPASTTTGSTSQPETPVTTISQASGANVGKNGQSRTIRVLPTSRQGTPQRTSTASGSKDATTAASAHIPSRRGSLSSAHLPGTPVSERISDTVSMTSTSMSRANSPPPSKVGTAPVRHVTKSQQKKERQAKAKEAEQAAKVEEPTTKAAFEEPVQAPIIGRKKKQKKAISRGTADSTPAVTRPTSPQPHEEDNPEQEEAAPSTPIIGGKEAKPAAESEAETPISPAGPSLNDQTQSRSTNPAALFTSLRNSGEIDSKSGEIFKLVLGINHRFETDAPSSDQPEPGALHTPLTDAQNQRLDQGETLCIDQPKDKQTIVLPDRRTLRGLSPEQASRYLALRTQALATSTALHHAGHGPAPPKQPRLPSSSAANVPFLPNPFLSEAEQAPSAFSNTASHLPQAFGSAATSTAYLDDATAAAARGRGEKTGAAAMSVEDAEAALAASRRETETLEKRLNKLLTRNRRLVFGGGS